MTEPVAYMLSDFVGNDFTSLELPKNPNNPRGLYFKEQLHPRVKMTQAEFDEWQEVFDDFEFFSDAMSQGVTVEKHVKLFKKIYSTKDNDLSSLEIEVKFAVLWAEYSPESPEETIEIIPDMKWFVRSKEKENGHYQLLSESRISDMPRYTIFKSYAMTFDTKEEAEFWTNPLTEAVQLPVEGER